MIPRSAHSTLRRLADGFPVVAITGPRQAGKTTLARAAFPDKPYVSVENPDERLFARDDPVGFLARFPDGAVIDEAQQAPDLFSYLQGRVDEDRRPGRFILTGSQHFGLLESVSQSLAGRVGLVQLLPFTLGELAAADRLAGATADDVLIRGLFPPLYDRPVEPALWYANYLMTYIERDVRRLSNIHDFAVFQRFIKLCAGRSGQLLNLSNLAVETGIAQSTARGWLGILETSYVVFLLPPHHRNFGKRVVKTPKLYFVDPGLAAALLGIQSPGQLSLHPARGALFETLVVTEYLKRRYNKGLPANLYFWRDNTGNEVDLVLDEAGKLLPVEIKSGATVTPDFFKGIERWRGYAGETAGPATVVYTGDQSYRRRGFAVRAWNVI
jgi:predicted AAA+ superfamily ATPase